MLASIDMHRKNPRQLASISTIISTMADLLVRGVEESVVRALKKRAGEHGRSAEAEHRSILTAVLLHPPRRKLADLLASMPDVGCDDDFARQPEEAVSSDGLG
jgi:plasmid stability protein